jgi:uncharacterized damage-inducible protein DinB
MMSLMIRDELKSLLAYNRWADERVMQAVRRLTPEQYVQAPAPGWSSVRATLLHGADASWIWARRLRGETVTARTTESEAPRVEDAAALLAQAHEALEQALDLRSPEQLAAAWSYRNFQGKDTTLPLWAVFRHIVNHATYHRGQIASKLKLLGIEPPVTDLLVWAIEQTPQSQ